jgi:DNA repair exonuclease SbcCD ATPase subunit
MLRCGECGEAMLPRSDSNRDKYVCRTRKQLGGVEACSMPNQDRAAVDGTFFQMFENVTLDLEATRRQVAEEMSSRLEETEAQADRATREVARLQAEAQRADRDYRSGELSAASYERLSDDIAAELGAAKAEAERLREHTEAVRESADKIDGEAETLRALAELRTAIAGKVKGSEGLDALRAAIASVSESVEVRILPYSEEEARKAHDPAHALTGYASRGNAHLFPRIRPELVEWPWEPADGMPKAALSVPENKLTGSGVPE